MTKNVSSRKTPPAQMNLGVGLRAELNLDNYCFATGPTLVSIIEQLWHPGRATHLYIWGDCGTGKTHLLQGCITAAEERGLCARYLSGLDLVTCQPAELELLLDGMELCDLVCIDDFDAITANTAMAIKLFHFYNRLMSGNNRLLVSATINPRHLCCGLEDLRSRLQQGIVFHLTPLDDQHKQTVLISRARQRGMLFTDEVARFIMSRSERSMTSLMLMLDRLDSASLNARRRITIPFVKEIINRQESAISCQ
jgi:DnaA family protein